MRTIVRTSLKYHFLVITLALVLMLVGVNQMGSMPVDVLPEFSPPYVEIQTEALGLSAEEVEQMITVPMEQDLLAGVAWLDVISSKSVPGLSSVLVYFEPGTDLYRARQMVAERLAQAAVGIPQVSKPPAMIQPTSSASRFMIVGLSSQELTLIEMSVLARWTIGPRLMGVPGVANVSIWGYRDQQLQVLVDPEQLRDLGVTLNQIVQTTGNALWVSPLTYLEASTPGTGGFIDTPNQRIGIWHVLPISSPEDLAQVPVARTALTLGDMTRIVEDHQPLIGDAIKNDASNLLLVIEKLPETNTLEVTRGVEDAIAALRPGFSSIDFDATLYRPATFIETAMANLAQTLVIAAILVALILGVFFYGWRTALISLVTIPVSLITALYVLHLQGATLNTMVLAGLGIALGLVIDDAVVDLEHIVSRLRQNRRSSDPRPVEHIIFEASTEVRGSLFFGFLVVALASLPVFFLQGVSGAIFQPLVVSYLMAVLAGMVVAMTVTPVLSLWFLSKADLDKSESPLVTRLRNSYEEFLKRNIQSPKLAYAVIVILVIAGLVAFPFLRQDQMVPAFQEPYVMVRMDGTPGTSQPEMDRIVIRASSELRSIQGVQNVAAHIGRAITGDQVVGVNSAELWVHLDPNANYETTVSAIEDAVNGYPGLDREVRTYLQNVLIQRQPGPSDQYTLRLYGEDHRVLRSEAQKLQQTVAGISGVANARAVLPLEEPTVEIEVDLNSAQRFGVKPGDVRRAATTLLSGIQVGSLFEEQKVFDVVVWSIPEVRQSMSDINNLLIDTPGGGHVRLGEVADVRIAPAPTVINREAISPYVDIVFNVQGRGVNTVLNDVKAAMQSYPFPLEYHAELKGEFQSQWATRQATLVSGLVAMIGIFLLLQAATRSWKIALVAFFAIPAATAGGILAAFLGGNPVSTVSLYGLFAVFGLGVHHTILLFRQYHLLEREGQAFGLDQVLRGSGERLAPMLMTTLATALAMLPFTIFGNIPGLEVARPIAVVILGGLVTLTLVNLLALPALYLRFGASREAELDFQQVVPSAPEASEA
jgi:CzcA family heavy metal efflux pump